MCRDGQICSSMAILSRWKPEVRVTPRDTIGCVEVGSGRRINPRSIRFFSRDFSNGEQETEISSFDRNSIFDISFFSGRKV